MAITNNATIQEVFEQVLYYGVPKCGFKVLPYVSLSNETRKKHNEQKNINIELNKIWGADKQMVEEDLKVVREASKMRYVNNELMKDEEGNAIIDLLGYKQTVLQFYFMVNKPEDETYLSEKQKDDLKKRVFIKEIKIDHVERKMSERTSKCEYISNGSTQWAQEGKLVQNNYFNPEGARRTYGGESDLIDFLCKVTGLSRGSITIDNFDKLFKGDVREIERLLKEGKAYYMESTFGKNWAKELANGKADTPTFKALLAIKLGRGTSRQDIYKEFITGREKNGTKIHKQILSDAAPVDKKGNPKKPYQYTGFYGTIPLLHGLKVYEEEQPQEIPNANQAHSPVSPQIEGNTSYEDDDLPF